MTSLLVNQHTQISEDKSKTGHLHHWYLRPTAEWGKNAYGFTKDFPKWLPRKAKSQSPLHISQQQH